MIAISSTTRAVSSTKTASGRSGAGATWTSAQCATVSSACSYARCCARARSRSIRSRVRCVSSQLLIASLTARVMAITYEATEARRTQRLSFPKQILRDLCVSVASYVIWSQHSYEIRSRDNESLLGLEVAHEHGRVLRRHHRRQQVDRRRRVDERKRRRHDRLDRIFLDAGVAHELFVEMRLVERADQAMIVRHGNLREVVLGHDANGLRHRLVALEREELA